MDKPCPPPRLSVAVAHVTWQQSLLHTLASTQAQSLQSGSIDPSNPPMRITAKALKMTETTPVVLTRALLMHTLRRDQQRHYLSARSMHDDL